MELEENKLGVGTLENDEKSIEGEKNKSSKKKIIPLIILLILFLFIIIFSVIFSLININNKKIMSGVSITGIDVSGLTLEDAKSKLQELALNKRKEDVVLKYNDYETSINGEQINVNFDVEKAINEAFNIGRDGNIITNNYAILFTQISKKDIELPFTCDEKILREKINDASLKMPGVVKQSSYYIEDDKLIIVNGENGIKIKTNEMETMIIDEIKDIDNKNNVLQIPVEEVKPDAIDLEKIRSEIYKEPQDAYVSKNPTAVHTHVNGIDFKISIDEAKKMIEEDKKEYVIPLKITVPKKTISDLGEEAFADQLAKFTTRYDASNSNRSNNVSLAAQKINGTIIMPGETFSYNKVVGARTIEAGYKLAGAYSGGQVVQDVGGGICQISSTLYNTALLANLEIVDRSNHQFQTSYVDAGRDATVSWGSLDFKFKNSRTFPIKIVASAKNGIAEVSLYGIKEETEYEVVIQSEITSYIPFGVKYVNDSTLAQGKEVIEQAGYNGCKSETYRILKLNGKEISRTLLSRDTYAAMQRIVRRGTKTTKTTTQKNTDSKTTKKTTTKTTKKTTTKTTTTTNNKKTKN